MRVGKITPPWGKQVLKNMIDLDMSMNELAKELDTSRSYVSNVVHGKLISDPMREKICNYMNGRMNDYKLI